jgi:hypothetical protein
MSADGKDTPAVPGMLLRRYADETDRNAIRNAFYGFAAGDPNTFSVRFAVLLEAHATAMEMAPEVLKHRLAVMLKELRELMAAYQADVRRAAEKVTQHEAAFNEALRQHRAATDRQIAELRQEIARNAEAAGKLQRHADRLSEMTDNRVAWGLGLAFVSGGLIVTVIPWLLHSLFH